MTIPYEVIKAKALANPETRAAYDALAPEFENPEGPQQGGLAAGAPDRYVFPRRESKD